MHLDLLPCRNARWHSHHNLLPGMVDEELLTRLDACRHLYAKEWHAPRKWVGCACQLALRLCAATTDLRFQVQRSRGIVSCNFEVKTADIPLRQQLPGPGETLVSARLARRGRGRLAHWVGIKEKNCCRQEGAPSARRALHRAPSLR